MKKIALLILCSLLFSIPALAETENTYAAQQSIQNSQSVSAQNSDDDDDDDDDNDFDPITDEYYGCDQSPDFNNREGIDQDESNYGYEGAGGSS